MKNRKIIIGSRGSKLALIYAEKAKEKILTYAKNFEIEEVTIKEIITKGDKVQDQRLSELGGKGLFSKTIEVESKFFWHNLFLFTHYTIQLKDQS